VGVEGLDLSTPIAFGLIEHGKIPVSVRDDVKSFSALSYLSVIWGECCPNAEVVTAV
jgi:hypothetical protein